MMRPLRRPLCLTILACVPLLGCDRAETTASLGTLERDRVELRAESDEAITGIFVREGDQVGFADPLVAQDTARAEIALARARADEAVARAALVKAEAGPRQQQISGARARLEAATSQLRTARLELERAVYLKERKLTSQNQIDGLQGKFNEAEARVREASAALDELLEGTRSEDIDQARFRHAAAVATVQDLEITLTRATTTAPLSGIVEALPFELGERPGRNATLVVLLASGRTYARVHLAEPLRTRLKSGSKALIHLDGHAEPLTGKVRWIAATASFTPYFALNEQDRSRLSYVAEVDLDKSDDTMPVGVPVEVTFPDLEP